MTSPSSIPLSADRRAQAFNYLIEAFQRSAGDAVEARWLWLEAAHVTGQSVLKLHWQSHVWMLRHARQSQDRAEIGGQLFRLALVPLGHLLQRLPLGNIGRSHVNAFKPMVVPDAVAQRIREAWNSIGAQEAA
ncbi:MAG: DUF3703 domain-containing protein [Ramlibacter sp.]|nr:DUF3703 domain-containing protein [Ramlibacter sp.]MCW5648196.1 DUF3703 domain-containing protein [Ramlibacter sp.]